ncbi:helix-turn-helix domain-containing protein [Parasulfitobacter algicola]|uniref:Helix-turn-helix transcriptional regulator n=1 Tax=Parasulfitobacter algicola TaxID=2614809 RepID=A0ABX2IW42_9RHOB|nr:XRE family transcriptional regulator [Sulfitobacter algicola]NSX55072.1 helix-turn-helix transcriptional regulator [Sulfitobacter algicola]
MKPQKTLGADLRAIRKSRKITLEVLAEKLGKSVGWLSQIERDISEPDNADLQRIAQIFGVPVSLFFGISPAAPDEQGKIVRADQRRIIGERAGGLIETLLSPDLTDNFEVVHSTFQPGADQSDPVFRQTQELAYLVSGKLDIRLDNVAFTIATGDSFRIRNQSFRWSNPYDAPAIAVWVISPPVY